MSRTISAPPPLEQPAAPSASPLHLARHLEGRIRAGEWRSGDQLPTLRSLARDFDVSFATARTAIAHLERRGVVYSIQGSGTFVSRQPLPVDAQRGVAWVSLILDHRPHTAGELNQHLHRNLAINQIVPMSLGWRPGVFGDLLERLFDTWRHDSPRALVLQAGDEEIETAIAKHLPASVPVITQFRSGAVTPAGWHSVDPDYGAAFRLGVEQLLAQGHRRIGLVLKPRVLRGHWRHTWRKAWMPHTAAIMGAAAAVRTAGVEHALTLHYNRPIHGDPSALPLDDDNLRALTQWLSQPEAPTAVIADDFRLPAVRLVAQRLGRRIGHDLHLVAVGHPAAAVALGVPCVDLQWEQVALQIVSLIQTDPQLLRTAARRLLVSPRWCPAPTVDAPLPPQETAP